MYPKFHGITLANGSVIENLHVERLAADPVPMNAGRVWLNTTDKKFKFSGLDAGGAVVVYEFATEQALNAAIASQQSYTDAALVEAKAYADGLVQGLDVKQSVRTATVAAIADLSGDVQDGAVYAIDGVALNTGDRILVRHGASVDGVEAVSAIHNGIYTVTVTSDGAQSMAVYVRADDADNTPGQEVTTGMYTFVEEGSKAGNGYVLVTTGEITLGLSELEFSQFSGAGQITAGVGLDKDGNLLWVKADGTSLTITAAGVKLSDALQTEIAASTSNIGEMGTLTTAATGSLVAAINELDADVQAEVAARTASGAALQGNIDTVQANVEAEEAARIAADADLQASIDAEAAARAAATGDLSTLTTAAKGNLVAALNEIDAQVDAMGAVSEGRLDAMQAEIDAEEVARAEAVTALQASVAAVQAEVDAEEVARADADTALQAAIDAEVQARTTAVAAVQAEVDAEEVARADADTALQAAIDAEAAARAAADGDLSTLSTTAKGSLVAAINEVSALAGEGTASLQEAINATKFGFTSQAPALTHTVTHNLNASPLMVSVFVQGDDGIYRNDIVAVEETTANSLTIGLTESRNVKVAVMSLADV